ncbi:MAG: ABC transporter permease [Selenomonadaceae bacterium]|nr:ABC transporter permease [Selenomonadaceae bacterium]
MSFMRFYALTRKEFLQLIRDRSSLLIGAVLPLALILIIGYGISLDVKNISVAVVLEDASPDAQRVVNFLDGSEYYSPIYVTSMNDAVDLMRRRKIDAIIVVPPDFSQALNRRDAQLQLILYGVNTTTANAVKGYIESGVAAFNANFYAGHAPRGLVTIDSRIWFNDANSSTWYFIPGLIMLILTIIGIFLTALVMAREWERGTLESLFVTPVRVLEILLSKMIPYFVIAMFGLFLCLIAARYLYEVPLHGSLAALMLSSVLYLFVALGIGLVISSVTKSQFLAAQVALIVGFLPSVMLTGFLFDLHSVPTWVSAVGHALPATYYLELLKTIFLAGDDWRLIAKNCLVLATYAVLFISIALKVTRKRVG